MKPRKRRAESRPGNGQSPAGMCFRTRLKYTAPASRPATKSGMATRNSALVVDKAREGPIESIGIRERSRRRLIEQAAIAAMTPTPPLVSVTATTDGHWYVWHPGQK